MGKCQILSCEENLQNKVFKFKEDQLVTFLEKNFDENEKNDVIVVNYQ